jgi:hypothetical protein
LITCYTQTEKNKSIAVLTAFAAGCDGKIVSTNVRELLPGAAAFYGVRPAWAHLWNQAKAEQRNWYYLDNAWFDVARETYFRIGVRAMQTWSMKPSNGKRLAKLGVRVKAWRKNGNHIVVCPQSDEFMRTIDWPSWRSDMLKDLRKRTDRQLVIRTKKSAPLALDLKNAWLLVTHSSTAAIEALVAGIPVLVTDRLCAAAKFSSKMVESPLMIAGREDLAERLADSQWTLDEMRAGMTWGMLNA